MSVAGEVWLSCKMVPLNITDIGGGNKVASVDFVTLTSLDRVKADQNGTFLSLWGKIAFKNLLIFIKEAWKPSNSTMRFFL